MRSWYAEHLGIDLSDWGGMQFDWTPGGSTSWAVFEPDTEYLGRPEQQYMINFRVENLDALLSQMRAAGVDVVDEVQEHEHGRFGWAHDCEGNKFELWQPPEGG